MAVENNNIKLLTWMATNRDPRFLENVVYALERETGKKVSTVYYLHGGKEDEQKEIQQILANVKAFFNKKLEIVPIYAGIFNHSSHKEVLEHAMSALEPRLNTMGDICINISSGTPTMSTAWMFLKALDFFRGRATYYDAPKYQPTIHRSNDVVPKEEQKIHLFDFSAAFSLMTNIRAANRKVQPSGLVGPNRFVRIAADRQFKNQLRQGQIPKGTRKSPLPDAENVLHLDLQLQRSILPDLSRGDGSIPALGFRQQECPPHPR